MDVGLLVLRVAAGLTLAAHGSQKLFGWFGGPGRDGFAGFLESLGFRRTRAYTWVAGGAELVGGLLFAFGLLTPLAAAAIIGVVLTAAVIVHAKNGFFNTDGGYELPALLGVVAASVAITGPGAFSVDAALGLTLATPEWALAGILLGVAAAAVTVGVHRLESRTAGAGQPRTA